ncbi:heterokaryon incompatibility protein [Apiospora rasikravindrae]|uniref:Heterokaryon incompatibility protein n=1 Tax=Apiospora rasikravindrae TaxID=990691 RepID=A0ABR1RR97_9PEZI
MAGSPYRKLNAGEREIRVLCISSWHDEALDSDILRFSTRCIRLQPGTTEPYIAVSYCWGTSNERKKIMIDNIELEVPESSVRTLRKLLRGPGELIWIDAICINQQDQSEKGDQVAMMKDIYSEASEVRIWLGELPTNVVHRAKDCITQVYEQCRQTTNGFEDLALHFYGTGTSGFRYSEAALPDGCDWEAIRAVYSLPWFTRLWVVQEIGLARKATCYIGKSTIDAETLTLSARWMVHRRYTRHFGGQEIEGIENASSMYRPVGRPLSNQLRRMHRQNCKDPRDRVYGLLGLLRPSIATAIIPDYNKSLVQVYADAIHVAIEEDRTLALLHFATWYVDAPVRYKQWFRYLCEQARKLCWEKAAMFETRVWPSWVLKFHAGTAKAHGSCTNILAFEEPDHEVETRWLESPLVLSLRGLDLGRIAWVSPRLTEEILADAKRLPTWMSLCLRKLNSISTNRHSTITATTDDLAATFLCGAVSNNHDADFDAHLPRRYTAFIAWCNKNSAVGRGDYQVSCYLKEMWRNCNRRFFILHNVGPHPDFLPNEEKCEVERRRVVTKDLSLLRDPAFSPHVPYSWGFTIYRAVPGREHDARFAEGMRRLSEWMRWMICVRRYTEPDMRIWQRCPELMPQPHEHDRWDDVAARLWNEVVEDHPDADQVDTTELGEEDFAPVGEAFLSRVDQLGVDTSRLNARYDFCLIIDETVLQMLEGLPAETPPLEAPKLGPRPPPPSLDPEEDIRREEAAHQARLAAKRAEANAPPAPPPPKSEQDRAKDLCQETWVWILDRETSGDLTFSPLILPHLANCGNQIITVEKYQDGKDLEFPPWARIRLRDMYAAWFDRAKEVIPNGWELHIQEDRYQWDKIRWWVCFGARTANEVLRRYRAQAAATADA